METAFSFMENYLQTASFFVHVETFNKAVLVIFWQFASGAGCV